MRFSLDRFLSAQETSYAAALREIKAGRKESHWIWFIFPQIEGLGHSATAQYYAIQDRTEAMDYWKNPVLSGNLLEITQALLLLEKPIEEIMGYPDHLKLRSSMTLFYLVTGESVFKAVLDKFFDGKPDEFTVNKLADDAAK